MSLWPRRRSLGCAPLDACGAAPRVLAIVLLATLAACSTLEGAQRPAASSKPSEPGAPPSSGPQASPAPGGGGLPAPPEAPPPSAPGSARPQSQTSGATQALLAQSRAARSAGNYAQANATIERALRIAPSDASLWVELGEIELATGNNAQAATLARKALTLAAPDDRRTIADAQKLLRAAGGR